MKVSIKRTACALIACALVCLICCIACNKDDIYEKEKYKNVVYLLSGGSNIYSQNYSLKETESVQYFSVGCGGSKPNPEEITVTLEPDRILLDQYNLSNFDIDTSSYAKILPADRYEIESYTVVIPANPTDQYVKMPVKVRPVGLSPDSTYFIPLAIKSVSRYEVNDDKYNMLYSVRIVNDYADQNNTYYTKKGYVKNQSTNSETTLSGTKRVQPLAGNKVRMFTGNNTQSSTSTVADINRYAIVVEVKEDSTLVCTPYGSIEVETLEDIDYNRYSYVTQYNIDTQGYREQHVFALYYRYRTLNDDGVTFSVWMEVKETLTLVAN
jgi:hypothetical protein